MQSVKCGFWDVFVHQHKHNFSFCLYFVVSSYISLVFFYITLSLNSEVIYFTLCSGLIVFNIVCQCHSVTDIRPETLCHTLTSLRTYCIHLIGETKV